MKNQSIRRRTLRIFSFIFALLLVFTACSPKKEVSEIQMLALKGPTSMGLAQLLKDQKDGNENTLKGYSVASSPDQALTAFVNGEVDLATVPSNMAALLYQKLKGDIQVLHINTLGVLYIVEAGQTVKTLKDLEGRTLYAAGKGATPEYALAYLLDENGIDRQSVHVEWQQDHTQALQALAKDPQGLALLPQPFVTVAQTKMEKLHIALDLTEEWDKIQEGSQTPSALVMGVTIARKSFVDEHKSLIDQYLKEAEASITFVRDNPQEAGKIIGDDLDIIKTPIAQKALPYCNITYIDGQEMKDKLQGFLTFLFKENPKSVGGQLPGDDFYYLAK